MHAGWLAVPARTARHHTSTQVLKKTMPCSKTAFKSEINFSTGTLKLERRTLQKVLCYLQKACFKICGLVTEQGPRPCELARHHVRAQHRQDKSPGVKEAVSPRSSRASRLQKGRNRARNPTKVCFLWEHKAQPNPKSHSCSFSSWVTTSASLPELL